MSSDRQVAEAAVARVVRDPLAPSPLLELAQLTLALCQRLDALERTQRGMEERLARLEKAEAPGAHPIR